MEFSHIPVLKNETIELLNVKENGVYFDGTLGGAGHSKAIEEKSKIKKLIGVDQDTEALDAAKKNLSNFDNVVYVNDNFRPIKAVVRSTSKPPVAPDAIYTLAPDFSADSDTAA